jgi:catechol 2,3-dioxygenase-like lactoylglutathione lyase family enzyme
MTLIQPRNFHRLAVAVTDVETTAAWLERVLGAIPVAGSEGLMQSRPGRDVGDLAGTDTRMLWVGGYPVILLGGGVVARFLERHGPGVQSWAWEVDDNWEVEHRVRDRGIDVVSPNFPGRFFFMQPKQTHGLLWEWCDGKMPRNPLATEPGSGVVTVSGLGWITGVVADADATAAWVSELMQAEPVEGNAAGPAADERTIDLAVGDIVVRLVTPLTAESRYSAVLDCGPRVQSFCVRVPDLDAALSVLEKEGVPTTYRAGALASTDPAATLGIHIDWTE